MPLLGVAVGVFISMAAWERQVAAELAQSPEAFVCGNPGILLSLRRFLRRGCRWRHRGSGGREIRHLACARARRRRYRDAMIPFEDAPPGNLIPKDAKREELLAEMDSLERMITQAGNDGEKDVLEKLLSHKFKLNRELALRAE